MSKRNDAFSNALKQLKEVKEIIKLDENIFAQLQAPQKFLEVNIPVKMDNGDIKVFKGYRSQYNNARGPFKGGIRFHPDVNVSEVKALSAWMTWKTSLVGLPLGGGKGGVIVDPRELSENELENLSRGYIRAIFKLIGPIVDVPAPDVYTNPKIMGWMMDEYEKIAGFHAPGVITGKGLAIGGSEVRGYSTAQGAVYVLEEAVKKLNMKDCTVAIQGFGNAGSYMAEILSKEGYKIIAVSDSKGTVYNELGIDVKELMAYKKENKTVKGFGKGQDFDNVLEVQVDILVPAALENVITEENADNVKAKIVIELANGPVTPEADEILNKKGILVIPDILANAGGVAVSYYEQVQNSYGYYWPEDVILNRLENLMKDSFSKAWKEKENHDVSLRMGCYVLAVGRVAEAMKSRGWA